jgi:hypothetical protein
MVLKYILGIAAGAGAATSRRAWKYITAVIRDLPCSRHISFDPHRHRTATAEQVLQKPKGTQ